MHFGKRMLKTQVFPKKIHILVQKQFKNTCFWKTVRFWCKNGSKTAVSNYRPISLLAAFSKIYEKVMHARLVEILNQNSSLYERQYGFRAGRSWEHALLDAQNTLISSLHKKQIYLLLLIDFSKAFDMVDHKILLRKLNHITVVLILSTLLLLLLLLLCRN